MSDDIRSKERAVAESLVQLQQHQEKTGMLYFLIESNSPSRNKRLIQLLKEDKSIVNATPFSPQIPPLLRSACPLIYAVQQNNIAAVMALIELGADLTKRDPRGHHDALSKAASMGDIPLLKRLKTIYELRGEVASLKRARYLAIASGQVASVVILFDSWEYYTETYPELKHHTALSLAVERNNPVMVNVLLGLYKTQKEFPLIESALALATAYETNKEITRILKAALPKKREALKRNRKQLKDDKLTPAQKMPVQRLSGTRKSTRKRGGSLTVSKAKLASVEAARRGDLAEVKCLLTPENVNELESQNWESAMMVAAKGGYVSIVKHLITLEADVNRCNAGAYEAEWGYNPLTYAAANGHLEVVKVLVPLTASLPKAIEEAKKNDCKDIVNYLEKAQKERLSFSEAKPLAACSASMFGRHVGGQSLTKKQKKEGATKLCSSPL